MESQWWSPAEIEELQSQKLRALIHYAYENVPYYREVFKERRLVPKDIRSKEDLVKLPILTKEIIRANFPDRLMSANYRGPYLKGASSGTTAEPIQFYRGKDTQEWTDAVALRWLSWVGCELGDRMTIVWGNPLQIPGMMKLPKRVFNLLTNIELLPGTDMHKRNLRNYVERIAKFSPKVITGIAFSLRLLAEFMRKEGMNIINPNGVITTFETLLPEHRATIEEQFRCQVYDMYGTTEILAIAQECEIHQGYHIAAEHVIVEFIKDGAPVSDGGPAKIVVTNLDNFINPFIRYQVMDMGIPTTQMCKCGRGLPLMKEISGRIQDVIVTPSGKFLHLHFFATFFRNLKGIPIKQFRIIQERSDEMIVKMVAKENFSKSDDAHIRRKLQQYAGPDIKITTEYVDDIPPTPSGKHPVVVSKVSQNFI